MTVRSNVMYEFLSPEWMDAVEKIREEHAEDAPEIPVAVTINLQVSDAPASVTETEFSVDTTSGAMVIEPGGFDEPDVVVSSSYDLIRDLIVDGAGEPFMQAFLEGQIQIQGDMARLMILQATIAQNADTDEAIQIAEKVRSITT